MPLDVLQRRRLDPWLAERNRPEKDRVPFHSLPPELLVLIFILLTHDVLDPHLSPLDAAPLNISHVCQRWRDIALSTPTLWRRVILAPSDLLSTWLFVSPPTQAFLGRSKGVPTEVFYAAPPIKTNKDSAPTLRSVLTALRVRGHRRPRRSHVLDVLPPLRSLYIHGDQDVIVDTLSYLHNHTPGFGSLESLELALRSSTPGELHDTLRWDGPERAYGQSNPWRTHRFPTLRALTLRDIPLAGVAFGQLPALREITLTVDTPLPGHLDFLRVPYFARLLACAPCVERLALLRAGPVFSLPLDTNVQAKLCWEDDAAWRLDSPRALPPVLLEHLRELEWTEAHPVTLHLFLMHFPTPRLEILDIAFAGPSKCKKLAAWLHPTFVHVRHSTPALPVLELSNLKVLRAHCSSGDTLRSPFLQLYFPALETLSLSHRNNGSARRPTGPPRALVNDDDEDPPRQLPRLESIFRDPRIPRLTHLLLSGFAVPPEQASLMLGYMPCLQRLDCNFILNIAPLLDALATARPVGVRVCPRLRHIQLWYCDGVEPATLTRLVKLRNGHGSEDNRTELVDCGGKRPIKPLPKGAHNYAAGRIAWQYVGTIDERRIAKVEQVSVEGCRPITGEEAVSLRQLGVEVRWTQVSMDAWS
ncbi:hypothetical protein F5148DRAFT_980922 [Russula earlei]|uniref:Uncharacterized protein n=1 Tax=Russula earlei TaxID=71964 RepID=A0ACC0U9G9_9AGAM|nr:hypothetical protein F5148DRAFT_980922 [Russula earlei]